MKKLIVGAAAVAFATFSLPAQAEELTVITAGDQNMVDYINDYLGPLFEKQNPGTTVRAVGTGPGDAGSQKILERLEAQKQAGTDKWDFDVAVVHQKAAGDMVKEDLLESYRKDIETGAMVTNENADMALGTDVKGYVMPMFNSQTAIAYNPALVANPPANYKDLAAWVKENPKQFGYNGIKGGMSGVAFVVGWVYAFGGDADVLQNGPFNEGEMDKLSGAFDSLKQFNQNVALTPGNAGTLDMLSRGEIAMGPVWVDMFYSWQANGQLPPDLKLVLPESGMPGQPMYYVIPAKPAHEDLAKKFIALATSPNVQAEGIVKKFNWYPGIDAEKVKSQLDAATWSKLFTDISPQELADRGKAFPIKPYFDAILETYERKVAN
ncbi:MAG: extracellular solute-binding protein [Dongiaceae bacterium]